MPAASSIIGQCSSCCDCPVPEIVGANVLYGLTYTSNSGDIGCVEATISGSATRTRTTLSYDSSGTLTNSVVTADSFTSTGTWNAFSGGSTSITRTRTVTTNGTPGSPETTTDTQTSCSVPGGLGLSSSTSGLTTTLTPDLYLGTEGGVDYFRKRIYFNPSTSATQVVLDNAAAPGSPWVIQEDDGLTGSGSITHVKTEGILPGTPGVEECAESATETGTSVSVLLEMSGGKNLDYIAVVTYLTEDEDGPITPALTQEFEITTDSLGDGSKTFAIPQPPSGQTRCVDTVEFFLVEYYIHFQVPPGAACYAASWVVTEDGESGITGDVWDGVVPEGYDPEDDDTWPRFGPFPGGVGVEITDLVGDCSCV